MSDRSDIKAVFCKECKHVIKYAGGKFCWDCRANPEKQHDYSGGWLEYADCYAKNAKNDCCEFERKVGFWYWLEDKLGL